MIVQRIVIMYNMIINPIYISKTLYNLQGFYQKYLKYLRGISCPDFVNTLQQNQSTHGYTVFISLLIASANWV